jgi:hypothetical protein
LQDVHAGRHAGILPERGTAPREFSTGCAAGADFDTRLRRYSISEHCTRLRRYSISEHCTRLRRYSISEHCQLVE